MYLHLYLFIYILKTNLILDSNTQDLTLDIQF